MTETPVKDLSDEDEIVDFQNSGRTSDTNGHWHAFTEESDQTGPPQPSEEGDDHIHTVIRGKDGAVTFGEEDGHTHDASVDVMSKYPGHDDDDDMKKRKKKKLFDLIADEGADVGSDNLDEIRLAELAARVAFLHAKHDQKSHGRGKKGLVGDTLKDVAAIGRARNPDRPRLKLANVFKKGEKAIDITPNKARKINTALDKVIKGLVEFKGLAGIGPSLKDLARIKGLLAGSGALAGGAVGGIPGAVTGLAAGGALGAVARNASEAEDAKDYENLNEIQDIEIFRTGKWNGDIYNEKDLDDMVDAFGRENSGFVPPVKVGHDKTTGARAFGWVESIRRDGDRLVADFVDVPDKVYELIKDRGLDTVSAEIFWNLQRGGKKFRRALKAVALLGAEIPAVSGLAPLRTVVNSQDEDSFERVALYEFKPFEVGSMDKIDELAAQIVDLETKLSEAEVAATEIEAADDQSAEFAEQLDEAVQAKTQAEDELKTAKAELDKAYKAKDTMIAELTKQVQSLQAAQEAATEDKRIETVERKAEYCKVPALREHIKSLYDVATQSERQVNFTQSDKTEEITAEQVVDKLVETINSDATKLFQEISQVEATNRTDTYAEPGIEVDKRVSEFRAKNADKSYEVSLSAVLASDPELAKAYAAS